jgi:osmotically-inducible protein OsmY
VLQNGNNYYRKKRMSTPDLMRNNMNSQRFPDAARSLIHDGSTTIRCRRTDMANTLTLPQRLEDMGITAHIKAHLLGHELVDGFRIHVDTEDGVVTLSGNVQSDDEKEIALHLAWNTPGVLRVNNSLRVECDPRAA